MYTKTLIVSILALLSLTVVLVYKTVISDIIDDRDTLTYFHHNNFQKDFQKWQKKQHKHYNSNDEESYRMSVFIDNEKQIDEYNKIHKSDKHAVILGVNNFSDMTQQEFTQTHLGEVEQDDDDLPTDHKLLEMAEKHKLTSTDEEESYDFRYLNRGVGVRHQLCGDCWANAAAQVTEMTFTKQKLSVQELINCDTSNKGCDGGLTNKALENIIKNGISYEKDVPYQGKEEQCNSKNTTKFRTPEGAEARSYSGRHLPPRCAIMKYMVRAYGVVQISLFAESSVSWSNYKGGILDHDLNADWILRKDGRHATNHAVTLVGYTKDYWLVQNSWGAQWGIDGYIKIRMGDYFNICHAASGYETKHARFLTETKAPKKQVKSVKYVIRTLGCTEEKCKESFNTFDGKSQRIQCPENDGYATVEFDGSYMSTMTQAKITLENEYTETETFTFEAKQLETPKYRFDDVTGLYSVYICDSPYGMYSNIQEYCDMQRIDSNSENNLPKRIILNKRGAGCGLTFLDQQ